jgi:hypothetical protein
MTAARALAHTDLTASEIALIDLEAGRPDRVDTADWQRAVADGRAFLAQWGERAAALGWTATDLFGLPPVPEQPAPNYQRLARVELLGLCWLLHGRPVTELTTDKAVIATRGGTPVTFYRRQV